MPVPAASPVPPLHPMRSVSRRLPPLLVALALLVGARRRRGPRAALLSLVLPAGDPHRGPRAAAVAAAQLRSGTLHAYLGADPFAGGRLPANVGAGRVAGRVRRHHREPGRAGRPHPREPLRDGRPRRARAGRRAGLRGAPYPITPFHRGLSRALRPHPGAARGADRRQGGPGAPLRCGPREPWRDGSSARGGPGRRIVGRARRGDRARRDAGLERLAGAPWLKSGWAHAHRPARAGPDAMPPRAGKPISCSSASPRARRRSRAEAAEAGGGW